MILEQHYLGCLAQASYLIGDAATGTGVVVDPRRDIDDYVAAAARHGLEIRYVILTHFHADFLAGHLELRERTGARLCLGARATADYGFRGLADGDVLELGSVRLRILETPGHTPESISILVYDMDRDAENPHAVLTGDTLFIGDVGRPDLMASIGVTAAELAASMYDSLHGKLLKLPDATIVYPGHGAGSMCGKNLSSDTSSTIGAQRKTNYALQPMSREEFVALVTADQPAAPAYFPFDAQLNRQEHPTLQATLARALQPLSIEDAVRLRNAGAQLLDTRDADAFASLHMTGSINIGLGGKYATWAGTVLDLTDPIVLISEPGTETEATTRLGRIGFDHVAGYVEGGPAGLGARGDLAQNTLRVPAESFAADAATRILDVRGPGEWEAGHVDGSQHIPLGELARRRDEVPTDARIAVLCASGYRSSIAASMLRSAGHRDVVDLAGGYQAWSRRAPQGS